MSEKPKINANEVAIFDTNLLFSIDNITDYNEKFSYYRQVGIIKNEFFSDDNWLLENNYKKEGYTSSISFDLGGKLKKYNLILKCLLLSKINENRKSPQPATIIARYKYLLNVIKETDGFNPKSIEIFEEHIEAICIKPSVIDRIIVGINDLEVFYPHECMEDFIEVIMQYSEPRNPSRARKLPRFKSLILFDHMLKKVFPRLDDDIKKKFYPLYLWWNITMIIPLRPSEFLKLKSDCCWRDKNNRYWIKVPRSKVEDKNAKIKLLYKLESNKKIYDMIQEYKKFVSEEFDVSKYLMPHEILKSCFSNLSIGCSNKLRVDKEKMNPEDVNSLLRQFYERFIRVEVGFENVEQLRMGDTRHYAFCNLLLQGLNGLTVAQIGGHTNLKSQVHYYQQLNICTDAYVGELADRIRLSRQKRYNVSSDFYKKEYKSSNYLALSPKVLIDKFLEIENGYCTVKFKGDEHDFDRCPSECDNCDFHILDLNKYPFLKKELQEKSSQLDKVIGEQIELFKAISKDMMIDYQEENTDFISDKKLKEISSFLKDSMNKKAKVDSYLIDYIFKGDVNDGM